MNWHVICDDSLVRLLVPEEISFHCNEMVSRPYIVEVYFAGCCENHDHLGIQAHRSLLSVQKIRSFVDLEYFQCNLLIL